MMGRGGAKEELFMIGPTPAHGCPTRGTGSLFGRPVLRQSAASLFALATSGFVLRSGMASGPGIVPRKICLASGCEVTHGVGMNPSAARAAPSPHFSRGEGRRVGSRHGSRDFSTAPGLILLSQLARPAGGDGIRGIRRQVRP
jgi:hypothetical protein